MLKGNVGYRIRNCFTLANATACAVGAGLALIGIFTPIAFPDVSQKTARVLVCVGIGLLVISLIMAVLRDMKNPVEKKLRVFRIISVLDKMYIRLEALVDEEKNKELDMEKFNETTNKAVKLMHVTVPEVSSADEARKLVESVEKELPTTLFPSDVKLKEKARAIVRMSRLMDNVSSGLKDRRKGDRKYRRLLRLVDEYYDENKDFIDEELRSLIRTCVDFNESAANFVLFKERLSTVLTLAASSGIPNILTPSLESDIEGFSDDAREVSRAIRVRIGEKIKRLVKGNGNLT